MTEAWLLADHATFASYFSVSRDRLPADPESLQHAKQSLLAVCAMSRSRAIRQDVTASGGKTGPLYVARINDFAATAWRASEAALVSDSLRRAIDRIGELPDPSADWAAEGDK